MKTILDFNQYKIRQEKIVMVTCYDYWSAQIIADTDIDCILVGDTASMIMHGHHTTVNATMDMMVLHTQAVKRGAPHKIIIGDMPFLTYRKSLDTSMNHIERLMQAGATAIKLEGATGNEVLIRHIVDSGVPIMGHLGLTPQSVHQLGGFRIQGNSDKQAAHIIDQAQRLQDAGCSALVLECVPQTLAKTITTRLSIPTIGIGAGPDVDGQVLVLHDLLGVMPNFQPKFLKTYLNGFSMIKEALTAYHQDVKQLTFPTKEHSYLE